VRYLAHHKQLRALARIPALARDFEELFGREAGGLLRTYRTEDAETIVLAMGSVNGTIKDVIDEMRDDGHAIGAIVLTSFRPFPLAEVRSAIGAAERVVVVEKNLSVGLGGVLASNVRMALRGQSTPVYTCIAGLGGRPITAASLRGLFESAERDRIKDITFLDLRWDVIERQIEHMDAVRRSGPIAENILRDLGIPARAE
jgi:pyruvate ferredoxin oxidoreductase alpha subunit